MNTDDDPLRPRSRPRFLFQMFEDGNQNADDGKIGVVGEFGPAIVGV
jgi:hypothetical protein